MLYRHCLEILNNFWTREPHISISHWAQYCAKWLACALSFNPWKAIIYYFSVILESWVPEEDEQETEQEGWNKLDHCRLWMIMGSFPLGQRKCEGVTGWSGLYFGKFIIIRAYKLIWRGANRIKKTFKFILQTWGNKINNGNQRLTSTYYGKWYNPGIILSNPCQNLLREIFLLSLCYWWKRRGKATCPWSHSQRTVKALFI